MEGQKRKTKTSAAVKNRYNAKMYDRITACVPKELAAAFKAKYAAEKKSQAEIIKNAIEDYLNQ